ncbi:tetratricopeptide repeat protein [Methanogenium sp. S4BF]|uniref:tetratricopeptide repeat protein n=1 Tax=Methanogenium sp. S4BF TaxID=1789226 RepID=UPI002417FF5E|nr:tetratricopeptide repeat protein [Methanogenium sp. S4BF]WFN33536.1 tetratricopeptide repeat protein [Methanogenium sp. S4BF]
MISENTELRSGIGNGLSEVFLEQKKYDMAVASAEWVLETNPSDIGAREKKADALASLEQYEEAAAIQQSVVTDKGAGATLDDWNKLAGLNAKAGNIESCVDAYETVLFMYDTPYAGGGAASGEPDSYQRLTCEKGAILIKLQRYDEAIACYQSAVDMNPSDASAWIGLGDAYLFQSLYDQGQLADLYADLGKAPPERDSSVQKMTSSSFEAHRKAVDAYQKAVEIDPLVYPAVAAKIMGSYEKTVNSYQDILESM